MLSRNTISSSRLFSRKTTSWSSIFCVPVQAVLCSRDHESCTASSFERINQSTQKKTEGDIFLWLARSSGLVLQNSRLMFELMAKAGQPRPLDSNRRSEHTSFSRERLWRCETAFKALVAVGSGHTWNHGGGQRYCTILESFMALSLFACLFALQSLFTIPLPLIQPLM